MLKFLNKKLFIISIIVLPLVVLIGFFVYLLSQKQPETISPKAEESEREKIISQQLKELEELRRQADIKPLTEEQKASQLKELEALRKEANIKPLSQKQIQKQLEELDKLRSAQ